MPQSEVNVEELQEELAKAYETIQLLSGENRALQSTLKEIASTANSALNVQDDDNFMIQFRERYSDLTEHQMILCGYLRRGLPRARIAAILGIQEASLRSSIDSLNARLHRKYQIDGHVTTWILGDIFATSG